MLIAFNKHMEYDNRPGTRYRNLNGVVFEIIEKGRIRCVSSPNNNWAVGEAIRDSGVWNDSWEKLPVKSQKFNILYQKLIS